MNILPNFKGGVLTPLCFFAIGAHEASAAGAGGGGAASTDYSLQGAIGNVGNLAQSSNYSVMGGVIGQQYQWAQLEASPASANVDEDATIQLSANATTDDGASYNATAHAMYDFSAPIASVDPQGLATAAPARLVQ